VVSLQQGKDVIIWECYIIKGVAPYQTLMKNKLMAFYALFLFFSNSIRTEQ